MNIKEIEKANNEFLYNEKAVLERYEKYIVKCDKCKYFCEFRLPEQVAEYEDEGGDCLNDKQPILTVCREFKCDNFECYIWHIQEKFNLLKKDFQWRKQIMKETEKEKKRSIDRKKQIKELETMSDEEFIKLYIYGPLSQGRKEK